MEIFINSKPTGSDSTILNNPIEDVYRLSYNTLLEATLILDWLLFLYTNSILDKYQS